MNSDKNYRAWEYKEVSVPGQQGLHVSGLLRELRLAAGREFPAPGGQEARWRSSSSGTAAS